MSPISLLFAAALAAPPQPQTSPPDKVEEAIDRVVDRIARDPTYLEFVGARERWKCEITIPGDKRPANTKYGVFRTHIEDDFGTYYSIVQHDEKAIIGATSTYGDTDITGRTTKWAHLFVIDRKARTYVRYNLKLTEKNQTGLNGICAPY